MLLSDVFENFRTTCLEAYGLDCSHYTTTPGFTFDAALKMTGVELELLSDIDMLMFVERGIRGGMSQSCSNRVIEANNQYMGDKYDTSKPSNSLIYLDANNLYGFVLFIYMSNQ